MLRSSRDREAIDLNIFFLLNIHTCTSKMVRPQGLSTLVTALPDNENNIVSNNTDGVLIVMQLGYNYNDNTEIRLK